MNFRNTKILILLSFLFFTHCGSANLSTSSGDSSTDGVILPNILTAVDPNLTGELFVYDTDGNRFLTDDMLFDTDGDGNDIAITPPMTLNKGETYRFIIIFKLSTVPVAHVDVTGSISEEATTNLSYTADDIISNSDDVDDVLLSDVSAGILPNLDLDEDGFSNLEEINGYSDPQDASSLPE